MPRSLDFEYILTPDGPESHRRVMIDDDGVISAIEPAPGHDVDGYFAVPGMPNAHSHAFQRAMVGYGEAAAGQESFWSWRDSMYALAGLIDPDDLYAIARQAFADMLRAGFTSVGEFHYLHHLPDGTRSAAMGRAVIEAARDVGLRMVFLPVYYRMGGFGRQASASQQRFVHESVEAFADYLDQFSDQPCGIAPHSLRAVPVDDLSDLLRAADAVLGEGCPVHMHIAEQRAEVSDCLASHGASPVQLLHQTVGLDARWSLVHATHANSEERALMSGQAVNLVLCPLTEAYLGDGLFPAAEYAKLGGAFAVGSDSNVRVDAVEELRLLEYGQRLENESRAQLSDASGLGAPLWLGCAAAGARALGLSTGEIRPGGLADFVVLDRNASPISGVAPERVMDAWLTAGSRENIQSVFVGGERRFEAGRGGGQSDISTEFARCAGSLRRRMESRGKSS